MWWVSPLLTYGRHYLSKYKKPLLYVAGAVTLFGAGYGSGWVGHAEHSANARANQAEAAVRTVVKEVVKRDEVERKVYVQDLAAVRKLEAERDALRAENVALQERVSLYVPENSGPNGGYLSVGLVGLLNDASAGRSGAASASAAAPSEEDFAPSSVGWDDFSRHYVLISGRYNDAMLQCNALIDWVDANVVNKPGQ